MDLSFYWLYTIIVQEDPAFFLFKSFCRPCTGFYCILKSYVLIWLFTGNNAIFTSRPLSTRTIKIMTQKGTGMGIGELMYVFIFNLFNVTLWKNGKLRRLLVKPVLGTKYSATALILTHIKIIWCSQRWMLLCMLISFCIFWKQ